MKKILKKWDGLDERQKQINYTAVGVSWLFLIGYVTFQLVYKTVRNADEPIIGNLIILCVAFRIIPLVRRIMGDIRCPRGITNKPLPVGDAKKDRRTRRVHYLLGGIIASSIITLMLVPVFLFSSTEDDVMVVELFSFGGVYNAATVFVICAVAFWVVITALFYWVGYVDNEQMLKEYNRMCRELEAEPVEE